MSQITSSLENVPIWQKTRKGNRWWRNRTSSEKRRRRSIWGGAGRRLGLDQAPTEAQTPRRGHSASVASLPLGPRGSPPLTARQGQRINPAGRLVRGTGSRDGRRAGSAGEGCSPEKRRGREGRGPSSSWSGRAKAASRREE